MKKLLLLVTTFINLVVFSQDPLGGTPVKGIIPIKRNQIESTITAVKKNESKTSFSDSTMINSKPIEDIIVDFNNPIDLNSRDVNTDPAAIVNSTGVTKGELNVSLTGGASYSIPIIVPPGINETVPQISLTYNSQGGNGLVGYGWNIAGVSVISRIPSTKFHDNTIDAVDFDNLDRFAFDGQRLVLKNTGEVYGGDGVEYQTENFSNVKISSHGISPFGANYGPAYFLVEYPDGSKAYYGQNVNSQTRMDWGITYWENPVGVRISYEYYVDNNVLIISKIKYGTIGTTLAINEIQFVYKTRQRKEQYYVGGVSFINDSILSQIKVIGNSINFRNYDLAHDITSLGYERLISITEKTGDNSKSLSPTVFTYDDLVNDLNFDSTSASFGTNNTSQFNTAMISGDFTGNGLMDFILYPTNGTNAKKELWLFTGINDTNNSNLGYVQNVGSFQEVFPISWLGGGASLGYKLMPQQGWCVIKTDTATNTTSFNSYSTGTANPIYFQDLKEYQFPQLIYYSEHPKSCISPRPPIQHIEDITKQYINGDFNGDGLTDVIVIENDTEYSYDGPCDGDGNLVTFIKNRAGNAYFLDLDKRLSTNYINIAGQIHVSGLQKLIAADVNGDGKTDLLHFSPGSVKVYSLNDNKQLILQWQISDGDISLNSNSPLFLGDYNGDGKMDFMQPKGYGNDFAFYYSTGTSFLKSIKILPFSHNEMVPYSNMFDYWDITPSDINNDGKTDLIQTKYRVNNLGNTQSNFDINVKLYSNKNDNFIFTLEKDLIPLSTTNNSSCLPIPIFLNPNVQNKNLELGFVYENKIISTFYNRNFGNEKLLKRITLGNGVKETITYSPLLDECPASNPFCDLSFTPSTYTENFPNFDIKTASPFKVVSRIEMQSKTDYRKQDYKYYGAVSNTEGLGFLGFRGLMKTNWYNDDYPVISNVSKHDISKRGIVVETYSVLGSYYGNFTNYIPSSYISRSVSDYDAQLLPNKVYKIKNTSSISFNGIEGTSKEAINSYDVYNNPTETIIYSKLGTTVQKTDKTTIVYENYPTGTPYIVGRPIKKNIESTYGSETFTEEELYTYNTAQLLSQVKKKGHNTNYLTEDNIYDPFGNITKKTITAQGLSPRITNYEYDPSGRFLIKAIDIESLATTYTYDTSSGLLLTETNPYGLTTTYFYDAWFRKRKVTDYLGKSKKYLYEMTNTTDVKVTSFGDDGSESIVIYDDLRREVISGSKNINDGWSYIKKEYDIYDREISISEPFSNLNAIPTQFSTVTYDAYGRTSQSIAYTGKTTTLNYSDLTTTVNDGFKTVSTTRDATGKTVSMTDDGGTITYEYFANGNLKKSSINGSETIIEQDGWGRKTKLTDPSAGIYEYAYNDLGEMTIEKTPNGLTDIKYDIYGKMIEKTITGLNTNSITTYTYNPTSKLLDYVDYWNINEMYDLEYYYTYDSFNRLIKTREYRTDDLYEFINELEYDTYGRVNREHKKATTDGKISDKWFKNTYKSGYHWQILDDASNQVLWQTNAVNERGQLTSANYGNGLALNKSYDQYGYIQRSRVFTATSPNTDVLNLYTTFEPQRGNLTTRTNSLFNWTENFEYDNLDRLTHYTNSQGIQVAQIYENDGRIKENTLGQYNYSDSNKRYQHTSIDINPSSKSYYENRLGLYNDGMEQQTGWMNYEPTVFSFDTSISHTGTTSLKIDNNTTGEKVVNSEDWVKIDNAVPTEYTYSAWVKSDGSNPQAEIFLFMKTENETGYFTLVDQKVMATSTAWVKIEKTFLVPANIKKLNIRLDNNATGVLWFDDVRIRRTSDATPIERELNISYNTWKSPFEIHETGVDRISFNYNHMNNRSSMFYGGLQTDKMQRQYHKHYAADGSMEIKHNTVTGEVEFVTYVGGDGYSAPVVFKSDGITQEYLYLHRDYLGSIVAITNQAGSVVEKRLFDAWGEVLKVVDGQGTILTGFALLDRGYTGHEHLQSVALIHMNGRLYDAKLHRFLQPDNFVQDPYNTQNYNRYGYVLNNPLKYTDFSGESWNQWWSKNWKTVVTITAAVATAVIIIASAGTATPLVTAIWAGAGSGFVGAGLGTALNGGDLKDVLINGLLGATVGAAMGGAGAYVASFAPAGIFNGALYGGTTNAILGGLGDLAMGGDGINGALFGAALGMLGGGYSGYVKANATGANIFSGKPATPKPNISSVIDDAFDEAFKAYQSEVNQTADMGFKSQAQPTTPSSTAPFADLPEFSPGLFDDSNSFSGSSRAWSDGATANSKYTYLASDNKTAVSNYFYNNEGKVIFQVDFGKHGSFMSGHGHSMSIPGNLGSGHAGHIPHFLVNPKLQTIPAGTRYSIPIGGN